MLGKILGLLGGAKIYLLVGAVSAVMAATGGFTLAWKLQDGNVERIQLADARQALADASAAAKQAAASQKLADDAGAAAEVHQAAIRVVYRTIAGKVREYVPPQDAARCDLTFGAMRLLDAAAQGIDPAGSLVGPGQPNDASAGVDFASFVDSTAQNYGTYQEVAGRLRDLQDLVRKHQAAPAAPSK